MKTVLVKIHFCFFQTVSSKFLLKFKLKKNQMIVVKKFQVIFYGVLFSFKLLHMWTCCCLNVINFLFSWTKETKILSDRKYGQMHKSSKENHNQKSTVIFSQLPWRCLGQRQSQPLPPTLHFQFVKINVNLTSFTQKQKNHIHENESFDIISIFSSCISKSIKFTEKCFMYLWHSFQSQAILTEIITKYLSSFKYRELLLWQISIKKVLAKFYIQLKV